MKRTKSAKSRASNSASQRPRNRRTDRPRYQRPERQRYQRTDRVSTLVQQVVASELERIDDEHLTGVVITDVEVDRELSVAVVFFDVRNPPDVPQAEAALAQHRTRLQRALGAEVNMRRTPTLRFRLDSSVAAAERIDRILDEIRQPDQPD